MNTRVKELEQAAYAICLESEGLNSKPFNDVFAEFIVRECLAACNLYADNTDRLIFCDKIKNHFGVK